MKWIDGPSVTEMDRGGGYEMGRQTNCQKNRNATKIDTILYDFVLQVLEFVISFDIFQWHFHVFLHFFVYPFQRHVLFPFLWHLVCPSISQALPLTRVEYIETTVEGREKGGKKSKTGAIYHS